MDLIIVYIYTFISSDPTVLDEVIQGLVMYFNKALGSLLLYQFERQQYSELRRKHPNKDMVDIYGAEHLLRLYGKSNG